MESRRVLVEVQERLRAPIADPAFARRARPGLSKQSCLKGIDAVKRLAADATVIEDAMAAAPTASKRATGRTTSTSAK